jgi:hypothetical protein
MQSNVRREGRNRKKARNKNGRKDGKAEINIRLRGAEGWN